MRYSPFVGLLLLFGLLVSSSESADKKFTNYEIFRAQVDTLSGTVVKILLSRQIGSISYRAKPGEIETFVRQKMEERLLENNLRLVSDSTSQLRMSVPLFQVSYSPPVASHIFASPDVERMVQSAYDVEISDSGEVKIAKSFSFAFSDTVNESDIPNLETGSYGFLRGKIDPGGFLDTILQPILFLASAAVLVYLFFTLRGS
ncbi:MAG TPA: hypothetical protein VLX91_11530 [Candidatus Acidoferrales bacterium]|nr:hypothetical protein [Candidatus Acidoferrales bacterium]